MSEQPGITVGSVVFNPQNPGISLTGDKLRSWLEFYTEKRATYGVLTTSPIIVGLIHKIIHMGESYIEWGYGTGFTAIAMANLKKKVTAYDPEIGLLAPAMEARKRHLVSAKGRVAFVCDRAAIAPADVVYSQGLLEHFDDDGIRRLVSEQLKYARKAVVFSVPSENYPTIDFGNERLMDMAAWERILEPFKNQLAQLYYYERRQHLMGVVRCQKNQTSS